MKDVRLRACIFDLDGVIVDTARYHFNAWKELADGLDIPFTEYNNERLKGVSRIASLEIILSLAPRSLAFTQEAKEALAEQKNKRYIQSLSALSSHDILPGVEAFIRECEKHSLKTAIASSSRNAWTILRAINLSSLFDAIIDGNMVKNTKPDPEIFLTAASKLDTAPENCVVFEDASSGIQAAKAARMRCIGIGHASSLRSADLVIPNFIDFTFAHLQNIFYD